jgi:asparagine synthase (glutamine-hydrolysing)
MCGVAGFLDLLRGTTEAEGTATVSRMADRIAHRGPDDSGAWADAQRGIFLAHRRLAIVDLSPAGHQPMLSPSGRYVIVLNGEIYNYQEIRRDLEYSSAATQWRGHSDTEVMLAAFEYWGVRKALERFVGMFAFVLWDRQRQELTLARDRLGEKPLYWGRFGGILMFASELKSFNAHPSFHGEVDRNALSLLLRLSYVPAPYSIFRGVRKILPGTVLRATAGSEPVEEAYWSARDAALAGHETPWRGTEQDAAEELERLLTQSIALQLSADVPVGAFLSGGIDSSTVVAIAQQQSARPVKTFSIGFREEAYDEARHAAAVARHLGTDHTELYVSPQDAIAIIPRLSEIYDEPFSDSSQIPTFLVSRLARQSVTVSLSGDAGDELFFGYNRYLLFRKLWRVVGTLPESIRRVIGTGLTTFPAESWNRMLVPLLRAMPAQLRLANPGDKLIKAARLMGAGSAMELYRDMMSHWKFPDDVVVGSSEPITALTDESRLPRLPGAVERMSWIDLVSYLPDDILVKVDRAAMAVSLESRIPLLDHRIVEFSLRLPVKYKLRNGIGKRVLRRVLDRHVPEALTRRPKMGFGVPIDTWLRGPLRDWAESLLEEARLRKEGFLSPMPIREKWLEHVSGKRNWHYHLWDVLVFQAWLEDWRGKTGCAAP